MAARRGEPAGEVAAIEHGMLTYVLLKGMGREGLKPVAGLDDPAGADLDGDGIVSTDELRRYADLALPRLARAFPPLVRVERGGRDADRGATGRQPRPGAERAVRRRGLSAGRPAVGGRLERLEPIAVAEAGGSKIARPGREGRRDVAAGELLEAGQALDALLDDLAELVEVHRPAGRPRQPGAGAGVEAGDDCLGEGPVRA